MKSSCSCFSFQLCPSIGDICLCINQLVLTDQTDFLQQTPEWRWGMSREKTKLEDLFFQKFM